MCTYQILGIELIIECYVYKNFVGGILAGWGGGECINKDSVRKCKQKREACDAHKGWILIN